MYSGCFALEPCAYHLKENPDAAGTRGSSCCFFEPIVLRLRVRVQSLPAVNPKGSVQGPDKFIVQSRPG